MGPLLLFLFCAFGSLARAATVTYDFNITWVTANPDDAFPRPVIGINGQWPIPAITANVNDQIIVNIHNQLGNQSTGLHFHGLYMNGTAHMDGPVAVTQCPVGPGQTFKYDFMIKQPGTYWYHSHNAGQYPDGLRGPLIIHDPESPYKDEVDEEKVLTLSDWYHDQMTDLMAGFISVTNPTGAEPVPNGALMNETQNLTTPVEPGKTYMLRIINIGAFAAQYFWIEGHKMQIVEVDGIYTEKAEADMIYLTAAQRYSVLVTTKDDASSNFAFVSSMDQDLFDAVPDGLNCNVTGWLVYNNDAEKPEPTLIDEFNEFDDFKLVPYDKEPLLDKVDHSITLDFKMDNLGDGANYAFFNEQTYVRPKVPTLYTALSSGTFATDPTIYGTNSNSFILQKDEVVELIINSADPGKHPFHLHGHFFQAVVRSEEEAGVYVHNETFPATPMKRDTFMVHPNGNIVLRFRANNPGVWLFHCHLEWHVASGLVASMIEAPLELQSTLKIPEDHYQICRDQGLPFAGNAAGNTVDLLDLKGENVSPAPLPDGFTPRGIVALTFSIIAAFLGLAMVAWYGAGEIGKKEPVAGGQVRETIDEVK
ncbi:uncharacterized protein KY384_006597 [Bacidia gigantensis]|uniref:uncharacterized protein n=1 Tax=Bacidia gigantensis TaxID=2732470 RepID=UPI001D03B701|nr:uncharacterized protein KY384_006597 [Bacidia gigantensis]KAG8528908.1 hypothetical protein KY384_006597 [Bacidia gigantensis]